MNEKETAAAGSNKITSIVVWVGTVLLAAIFLMSGAVAVIGAILLLIPCTAFLGGSALAVIMLGAMATHARAGEWPNAGATTVLFSSLVAIALFRRRQRSGGVSSS